MAGVKSPNPIANIPPKVPTREPGTPPLLPGVQQEIEARKTAQEALKRRIRWERIINEFSLNLIQAGMGDPGQVIDDGLAKVGSFSGGDRSYLFLFHNKAHGMADIHEWCAPGVCVQKDNFQHLSADRFPWWMDTLRSREVLHIHSVEDLPPEAAEEKKILSAQGIRSMLVVPVFSENRLEGFIGLDVVEREKKWSEEDTANLSTFANIISVVMTRNRIHRDLERSESRYRELFETTNDMVYTQDLSGRFITVNPALLKAFGYAPDELIGHRASEFMSGKYQPLFGPDYLDAVKRDGLAEGVVSYYAKDGRKIYVEYRSNLVRSGSEDACISGIGRDVTGRIEAERKIRRLQDEMLQSQKMEAIGTLAGGIAHDFNNLMMGIQGRISLMLMGDQDQAARRAHLKAMEASVQSAGDLTRQLLGFARAGRYEVRPTDMNDLVRNGTKLFGRTRKEIVIRLDLAEALWPVAVDRGQIGQVMLNLYLNARQSMPGGGTLVVTTRNITVAEGDNSLGGLNPGGHVCIAVTDTGVGMDEATRNRLFEPFFTTRQMGRGTGLGLASAYGIIKHHGGIIRVQSAVGKGSTFSVYLPVHAADQDTPHPAGAQSIVRGSGVILLVDDEALILDVG